MVELIFVENLWNFFSKHSPRFFQKMQELIIRDCNRVKDMPELASRLVFLQVRMPSWMNSVWFFFYSPYLHLPRINSSWTHKSHQSKQDFHLNYEWLLKILAKQYSQNAELYKKILGLYKKNSKSLKTIKNVSFLKKN